MGPAPLPDESERAAELLERLLTDADFRARFRRDPAAACEDFELPDLARDLGVDHRFDQHARGGGAALEHLHQVAVGVRSQQQVVAGHAHPKPRRPVRQGDQLVARPPRLEVIERGEQLFANLSAPALEGSFGPLTQIHDAPGACHPQAPFSGSRAA